MYREMDMRFWLEKAEAASLEVDAMPSATRPIRDHAQEG